MFLAAELANTICLMSANSQRAPLLFLVYPEVWYRSQIDTKV